MTTVPEPDPIPHGIQIRADYGIDRGRDYSIRVRDHFARRIPDPRADELAGRKAWRNRHARIEPPVYALGLDGRRFHIGGHRTTKASQRIALGKTYCIKGLRP